MKGKKIGKNNWGVKAFRKKFKKTSTPCTLKISFEYCLYSLLFEMFMTYFHEYSIFNHHVKTKHKIKWPLTSQRKLFNHKMIPSGKFMDKRSNLSWVLQLIKGDFICIVLVFELFSHTYLLKSLFAILFFTLLYHIHSLIHIF